MKITPTLILAALGGFAIVTALVALGQGAGDWWLWLLAGLLAEAGAVAVVWRRVRGARAAEYVQTIIRQTAPDGRRGSNPDAR